MMIREAEELFDCSPVSFSVVVTGKKRKKKKTHPSCQISPQIKVLQSHAPITFIKCYNPALQMYNKSITLHQGAKHNNKK